MIELLEKPRKMVVEGIDGPEIVMPNIILRFRLLTIEAKILYGILLAVDHYQNGYISYGELSDRAGLKIKQLRECVRELQEWNLIKIVSAGKENQKFILLDISKNTRLVNLYREQIKGEDYGDGR